MLFLFNYGRILSINFKGMRGVHSTQVDDHFAIRLAAELNSVRQSMYASFSIKAFIGFAEFPRIGSTYAKQFACIY